MSSTGDGWPPAITAAMLRDAAGTISIGGAGWGSPAWHNPLLPGVRAPSLDPGELTNDVRLEMRIREIAERRASEISRRRDLHRHNIDFALLARLIAASMNEELRRRSPDICDLLKEAADAMEFLTGEGWGGPNTWLPMSQAPRDRPVVIYAAPFDSRPAFAMIARWSETGGWMVDPVQEAVLWTDVPASPHQHSRERE